MPNYEVVEIGISGLSREDCRCVDRLGYVDEDGNKGERRASQAYFDIKGDDTYYIDDDGERHELEAATKFNTRYVRALPHDDPEDPLLDLPEMERAQSQQR